MKAGFLVGSLGIIGLLLAWAASFVGSWGGEYLSDGNIIINKKVPSPDGSKVLIGYSYDLGALGYGMERDAVIPAKRMRNNLKPFVLQNRYAPIGWEKDGSLTVAVDYVECIRAGQDCSRTQDSFYDTRINIQSKDETAAKDTEVEADLLSPNRKRRLVAYRYPDGPNLGRIHVSIIGSDEPIPRYGNFYIASMAGDGLLGARWESDSSIVFFTTTSQKYPLQYPESFRPNALNIRYRIEIDDSLGTAYLWMKKPPH